MLDPTRILVVVLGALLAGVATATPLHATHHNEGAAGRGIVRMFRALQGQSVAAQDSALPSLQAHERSEKRRLVPAWLGAKLLGEEEQDRDSSDDASAASSPSPHIFCHTTEFTGPCFRPIIESSSA